MKARIAGVTIGGEDQCVAIRLGLSDEFSAYDRIGPRLVVDQNRLLEKVSCFLTDDSGNFVVLPAGAKGTTKRTGAVG